MKNKNYIHYLDWSIATSCSNNLKKLKSRDYLIEEFDRQWIIVEEFDNFLLTLKAWPYSSRDCMLIYSWLDGQKDSLNKFNKKETWELFEILSHIFNNLNKNYTKDFDSWKKELLLGLNTTLNPWAGNSQSVSRPHFHISILSTIETIENNVKTEIFNNLSSEEYKKNFCNRKLNDIYKNIFLSKIKTKNFCYYESFNQSIDFVLEDSHDIYSNKNLFIIEKVYDIAYQTINSLKTNFKKYNNNPSFSIGFKKEGNKYIMKIKFINNYIWDVWWVMESFWHCIKRNKVEKPELPNLSFFKNELLNFL
jgi:hypothetical protein